MLLLRAKAERNCTALILIGLLPWARRLAGTPSLNVGVSSRVRQKLPNNFLGSPKTFTYPTDFPKCIWQNSILKDKAKWEVSSETRINLNPDWIYHYLDDSSATSFVHNHFTHRPSIIRFFDALTDPILRADLLRYLVLLPKAVCTVTLTPRPWHPSLLGSQLISRTESMRSLESNMTTRPAHGPSDPFPSTVDADGKAWRSTVRTTRGSSNQQPRICGQVGPRGVLEAGIGDEVLAATGPGLMSDTVLEVIRDQIGYPNSTGRIPWLERADAVWRCAGVVDQWICWQSKT
jgi:hypothetical protein